MIKKVTTPSQKTKKRVRNGYLLKLGAACLLLSILSYGIGLLGQPSMENTFMGIASVAMLGSVCFFIIFALNRIFDALEDNLRD